MYIRWGKRALDFGFGFLALLVLLPLLLVLTALGAWKMKGNPFFFQKRSGQGEKPFSLVKFRTMTCETDENGQLLPDEQRLVPYGKFLRTTSLDELPELWNILRGDMSFVGPRPLLTHDVACMSADQKRRQTVRPGLTGLAQCNGRNALNWDRKLAFDVQYVNNLSFGLDWRIVFRTVTELFASEDVTFVEGDDVDLSEWQQRKREKKQTLEKERQGGMPDIYFLPEYGQLCQQMEENSVCETFEYSCDAGIIRNMFIRRPVPWLLDGVQYYDIVTPYGYGGPMVYQARDREKLVRGYAGAFDAYCRENKIVCEFVRYHPIYRNHEDFGDVYENSFSRFTVGTDLSQEDPVAWDFGKSARREVRKAEENGVSCRVIPQPRDLSLFRRLYEETMDRNGADARYYFPDSYYEFLTQTLYPCILEVQAYFEGEAIGSELYFTAGDLLHAHLLGGGQKLLELAGGALMEATAARWGHEHGYRYIHHGGGRTSSPEDKLYLYKKKFGRHTEFEFYTGKRIWLAEEYERLRVLRTKQDGPAADGNYFPVYRG